MVRDDKDPLSRRRVVLEALEPHAVQPPKEESRAATSPFQAYWRQPIVPSAALACFPTSSVPAARASHPSVTFSIVTLVYGSSPYVYLVCFQCRPRRRWEASTTANVL